MKLETFFDNFETLAEAPNAVKKLRELILQLAIQGKLVPQDEKDEPARIEIDKKRLIQKRSLSLPNISEKNDIMDLKFKIPENWYWYRLSDVIFFQEGPGIRNWQFKSQGIKLLNVANILPNGNLFLENSDKFVSEDEFNEKYKHFLIEEGDLLFAASGGSWGKSAWFKDPGYGVMLNTSTIRLRFYSDKFEPNYLKYYLDSSFFKKQMILQLVGQQPNFGSTHLSRAYIPIPPLEEQTRIIARVDQLMSLCDELEVRQQKKHESCANINSAALDRLLVARAPEGFAQGWRRISDNFDLLYDAPENVGALRQSILQLAVMGKLVVQDERDEPARVLLKSIRDQIKKSSNSIEENEILYEIPKTWEWVRLGEIFVFEYGDGLPKSKRAENENAKFPVYGSNGIVGYHDEYLIDKPGIIVGRKGSCGALNICFEPFWATDVSYYIIPPAGINLKFAYILLKSLNLERLGKGIKPGLNRNEAYQLVTSLPPLAEQRRIVTKVDQLMSLCDELEAGLMRSQADSERLMEAVVGRMLAA